MAQNIALRIHTASRNKIVAFHATSHLELHEQKAYEALFSISKCIVGSPTSVLTLPDVEAALGRHWKQPGMLLLELPQREIGGQCMSWADLVKVSEICKKRDIALHLDGARLWEAQTFYNRPFHEVSDTHCRDYLVVLLSLYTK
jgi:threonine aldolase